MIGIDEVGRGAWAGPLLVVAARVNGKLPKKLRDSKKLTPKQRQAFCETIADSCNLGEGWVTAKEIDVLGLSAGMRLGVERALDSICAQEAEEIIMDGVQNYCADKFINVVCEPKADDKYPIVSAASIYAKVRRDNFMSEQSGAYLVYEFAKHAGYGTKLHMEMIEKHGVSDIHRLSFAPLRRFATV